MDFSQLQERVRLELLRRIERGTLSASLLARKSGLGQSHISNFLHGRRGMTLAALDRILAAIQLDVSDLMPARREALGTLLSGQVGEMVGVPLVSHETAIYEQYVVGSKVKKTIPIPVETLSGLLVRCPPARNKWDRFVAVRMDAEDAEPMKPVLQAEAVVVLDRHYTSFRAYVEGTPNLYGAKAGRGNSAQGEAGRLVIRYAVAEGGRVVLRPYRVEFAIEVLSAGSGQTVNDLLVGRVVAVLARF
jgi:transcriptional regulator with XRE-family HTH domain